MQAKLKYVTQNVQKSLKLAKFCDFSCCEKSHFCQKKTAKFSQKIRKNDHFWGEEFLIKPGSG